MVSSDKPSGSVVSNWQSGGITAHTVNFGSRPRVLDENLKREILTRLPRDKPIQVTTVMGDAEALRFAHEIHAFMKANGLPLMGGIYQATFAKPQTGLALGRLGPRLNFIVGANL